MSERNYLLKRDIEDKRDYLFKSVNVGEPEPIDLRSADFPEMLDQGSLGSCTAFAITALKQYLDHTYNYSGYYHYLSQLFLYYLEREMIGAVDYDSGAYIRDGMKAMQKVGCSGASFFPYDQKTYRNEPSADAYTNAADHRISEYWRLVTLHQLKQSLADKLPVVIGMDVYSNFESWHTADTGYLTMPSDTDEYRGGHAVLAMGFTEDGYIICRNSWGAQWGDKGYFYMPEDYVNHYVSDMWTGR